MTDINAEAFARAFMTALPGHAAALAAKLDTARADGIEPHPVDIQALASLANVKGDFCKFWPEAGKTLATVETVLGFFYPSGVAVLKAIQSAIDKEIVPDLCGKTG